MSQNRAQSAFSNYSVGSKRGRALVQQPYAGHQVRNLSPECPQKILKPSEIVPSEIYIERGQRWMEMEDASALRDAMDDMALTEEQREEARLHAAAQLEASELVFQHQNPEAVTQPAGPYKYKEHLRKNSYAHARTQSANGRYSVEMQARKNEGGRSVSGGSNSSEESGPRSRNVSGTSTIPEDCAPAEIRRISGEGSKGQKSMPCTTQKSYGSLSKATSSSKRRSSGKRNISGEPAGSFLPEHIYEEPAVIANTALSGDAEDMPAPLRLKPRNPLNRVQFVEEQPRSQSTPPEPTKKLSRFEIHRNPPSQSHNPAYTANPIKPAAISKPATPTKDGLEIRSDDIRQATSKPLKDRSAKLPTPVIVSDKPGRPIVSFDANWKPKVEADRKPAEEPRRPRIEHRYGAFDESKSLPALPTTKTFQQTTIPIVQLPDIPSIQVNEVPEISISQVSIPTINITDVPSISMSPPSITVSENTSSTKPVRALPDPKTMSSRPHPRHAASAPVPVSRGHWSPAPGSRATATCHQCQLPIEGRVVSVRSLSERFHPECLICYTCGTALEALEISPEPTASRNERIARIRLREAGHQLPEDIEGQSMADDGDERLRFYCHLDWHEHYAPRCKHCKTPILGEHAVALGEHWHYGHFFCAECGDPFEQGVSHVEVDGYAWCVSCSAKRTERRAPKCRGCRKGVVGEYVEALGGEWHENCFTCVDCGGPFEDGKIFQREELGSMVAACVKCMQRKWKA